MNKRVGPWYDWVEEKSEFSRDVYKFWRSRDEGRPYHDGRYYHDEICASGLAKVVDIPKKAKSIRAVFTKKPTKNSFFLVGITGSLGGFALEEEEGPKAYVGVIPSEALVKTNVRGLPGVRAVKSRRILATSMMIDYLSDFYKEGFKHVTVEWK